MAPTDNTVILSTAKWVQQNIQLVRWNSEEYEPLFGARSAKDVLTSRKTSYMAGCLDLTLAYIHLLKKKGYNPRLVVEEHVSGKSKQPTLHFATEIPLGQKMLTVDFTVGSHIIYYDGMYDPAKSTRGKRSLGLHRFSTKKLGYETTLNGLLHLQGTCTFYRRFPHVTPQAAKAIFRAMTKLDSPKLFERIQHKSRYRKRVR